MKTKIKHVCGQCNKTFVSELAYSKHFCPAFGITPRKLGSFLPQKRFDLVLEKKILEAVQATRLTKKQYNA